MAEGLVTFTQCSVWANEKDMSNPHIFVLLGEGPYFIEFDFLK